jgi:hypothetical protein
VAIGSIISLSAFFWRVYIFSHEAINSDGPSLRMAKRASSPDEAKETIYAILMGVAAFALSLFFLIFVIGMSCDQYEALTTGEKATYGRFNRMCCRYEYVHVLWQYIFQFCLKQ